MKIVIKEKCIFLDGIVFEVGEVKEAIIRDSHGNFKVDYPEAKGDYKFKLVASHKAEIIEEPKAERPDSDHYHTGSVDVWRFADENFSQIEVEGFHRINAIKYLTRYGKKGGYNRKDLEKAIVSINKLIEVHDKGEKR